MEHKLIYTNDHLSAMTHRLPAIKHYHTYCEFVLAVNGEALNTVDGTAEKIVRGNVFFFE